VRGEESIDILNKNQHSGLPILDIGLEIIVKFSKEIRNAGTVIMNGPAGVFEREAFTLGTVELIDAATKSGFSVIGGGHSAAVVERLFNLFWINGSWQKRLTAEDAENRRGLLFFSASLGVLCGFPDRPENNKKSRSGTTWCGIQDRSYQYGWGCLY